MHRYVILEHTWNNIHFDLMIEGQSSLKTWQLTKMLEPGLQPATSLPDHRLEYLAYEGPISGNRGAVKRVAEGTFTMLEKSDELLEVELEGTCHGRMKLLRKHNNDWQLEWNPTEH